MSLLSRVSFPCLTVDFRSKIDVVSLVVDVQIPMFVAELQADQKRLFESSMNGPTPDVPIQDIFALYRRTKTLIAMLTALPQSEFWCDLP